MTTVQSDTLEESYGRQRAHGREMELPSCYSAPDSVDNWRHLRMRAHLQPLLSAFPGARWLTVGDGAFGSDAHYLLQRGADAVASSLVTDTLQQAAARGFIKDYLQVNAEQIDLPDNSFDFVLCKEAYHHFPRPPIALYEALRVARHAVVLIEPQEQPRRPLDVLRSVVKRVLRGDTTTQFEPAGNYIYRLSVRDTERLMTAMGQRCIAFKPFNDFYWGRLARADGKADPLALKATQLGVGVQNLLSWLGLMSWGLCCLVVVKGEPDPALASALEVAGFRLRRLPSNPYAADAPPASAH
jgi:SAM-dependent methyltransferase